MLFHKLFTESCTIIPGEVTLSNIIEQFCQTFKVRLKDLIETKLLDWETKYPSLLKVTCSSLSDKSDDMILKDGSTKSVKGNSAFIPDRDQSTVSATSRACTNGITNESVQSTG